MALDPFTDRLARVRQRFVSTLEAKIEDTCASLPNLSDATAAAAVAVAEAYRTMHSIVGVGPTVGFPATGGAARQVENVLRPANHDGRGLTAAEVSQVMNRLHALRQAAAREMQTFQPAS